MAFTVTATQSGSSSSAGGVFLRLLVLTGANAAGGTAAAGVSGSGATAQASISPAGTSSLIVYALSVDGVAVPAAAASNTYYGTSDNTTFTWGSAHGHYSGTVTAGTPVTAGAGSAAGDHSNWAIYEILATGGSTPALDASTPTYAAGSDTATAATTASFTPPPGSVLVAMIIAGGTATGTGITMTVTDTASSGLVWTRRAVSSTSDSFQPCWVYTTTMAGPSGGPVRLPQQISRLGSRRRRSSQRPQFNQSLPGATVNMTGPVTASVSVPVPQVSVPKPVITGITGTGTGQYFVDQQSQPIMLKGDTVWGLLMNAGVTAGTTWQQDLDNYVARRSGQGFNAVLLVLVGSAHYGGINADGRTQDSVQPFTSVSPVTLNNTYFARADYLLASAAAQGMTVIFNPAPTFSANDAGGPFNGWSTTQFTAYGTALGNRYKTATNLIWEFGDDYSGIEGTGDVSYDALLTALTAAGDTHMISIENNLESTSRKNIFDNSTNAWGTSHAAFNWVYSYNADYDGVEFAYLESSPLLVCRCDGIYDPASDNTVRNLSRNLVWWALSSGSRGYIFGRDAIWPWANTAYAELLLNAFDASDLGNIFAAFSSLPGWNRLVPDTSSALVTAGRGTHLPHLSPGNTYQNNNAYVSASKTPAGDLAVIYIPSNVTITVNGALMNAGYTATWIDPASGATSAATIAATYSNPASNSLGQPDWVLVLQGPGAPLPDLAMATRIAP